VSSLSPTAARGLRLTFAVIVGYAWCAGLIALTGAGLPIFGMAKGEAVTLGSLLGLLAYPAIVVWVVATARPLRTGLVLGGTAALAIIASPIIAAG
jgi:hypothetical protein